MSRPFGPALGDQHVRVTGRQIQLVTDVRFGEVDAVDHLRELACQPHRGNRV